MGASLAKIEFSDSNIAKLNAYLDKPKNFLVFCGSPGIGKTYFLAALYPWAYKKFNSIRVWKENDLYQKLREQISENKGDYLKELSYMIDDQLVMVDDLGISKHNDWREEILFELIDTRYNSTLPTIFTSNLSSKQFKEIYHLRIASRLFASESIIVEIPNGEDLRIKGL